MKCVKTNFNLRFTDHQEFKSQLYSSITTVINDRVALGWNWVLGGVGGYMGSYDNADDHNIASSYRSPSPPQQPPSFNNN